MSIVFLNLFAGQGAGWTDGQSGRLYASAFAGALQNRLQRLVYLYFYTIFRFKV